MTDYLKCIKCERPMRPQNSKSGDHPGTINTGARGYCATCYYKEVRDKGLTRDYRRKNAPVSEPVKLDSEPEESAWNADEKQVVVTVALRRTGEDRQEILQMLGLLDPEGLPQNGPRNAIPANATYAW